MPRWLIERVALGTRSLAGNSASFATGPVYGPSMTGWAAAEW
jgi:hypothetical protein